VCTSKVKVGLTYKHTILDGNIGICPRIFWLLHREEQASSGLRKHRCGMMKVSQRTWITKESYTFGESVSFHYDYKRSKNWICHQKPPNVAYTSGTTAMGDGQQGSIDSPDTNINDLLGFILCLLAMTTEFLAWGKTDWLDSTSYQLQFQFVTWGSGSCFLLANLVGPRNYSKWV
jgi:hypothetical protein